MLRWWAIFGQLQYGTPVVCKCSPVRVLCTVRRYGTWYFLVSSHPPSWLKCCTVLRTAYSTIPAYRDWGPPTTSICMYCTFPSTAVSTVISPGPSFSQSCSRIWFAYYDASWSENWRMGRACVKYASALLSSYSLLLLLLQLSFWAPKCLFASTYANMGSSEVAFSVAFREWLSLTNPWRWWVTVDPGTLFSEKISSFFWYYQYYCLVRRETFLPHFSQLNPCFLIFINSTYLAIFNKHGFRSW
jgi:hypothetical protein